ncbi:MAG: Universal stress protein [Euryarchaeota archaeon ADurb.Bin294]|jgi:nucleotide-binding universal stress UspA family protein|nr:MAG: Universal stress protein [Euryarchaeota archaeon ADurb.Bin294]
MFTKVLIPYDFSDDAEYIIRCLKNIPRIREVILVHVTRSLYLVSSPERENPEADYARLRLEKVRDLIEMPRSKVRIIVEEITGGEISDAVIRVAEREQVSLILMGRRGRGVIETILLGSTAWDILRFCPSSLLLIHPPEDGSELSPGVRCPDIFTRALVCTDFSEPDIETLLTDILPLISSVDLFHVVSRGDTDEEIGRSVKEAEERLKNIVITCPEKSILVRTHVRIGDASDEIIRFSEKEDISLIVVKSTGTRGFVHKIIGGTTEAIARNAKKPLFILRRSE